MVRLRGWIRQNPFPRVHLISPEKAFYLALLSMPMVFLLHLMFAIATTGTLLA